MIPLPQVTFVIDQFAVASPGQQLLDRFLIGYHSDGAFRAPGCEVQFSGESTPAIEARVRDHGLRTGAELAQARATIIAASEQRVRETIGQLPSGARCFIYGLLSPEAQRLAGQRRVSVLSATATSAAFRLPAVDLPESRIRKCAIVTHGALAALDGLEALRSIAESRLSGLEFAGRIEPFWEAAYASEWRTLLASAFSRSNTIQGDALTDGRTQDVFGLHFLENLVSSPRAWRLSGPNGLTAGIFDFSGALEDINVAAELDDGSIRSAQLYRPPAPMSDHFSRLAERVERFFRADLPDVPAGLTSLWRAAEPMNSQSS